MPNSHWPHTFVEAVGVAEVRKQSYLVSITRAGDIACKACEGFVPFGEGLQAHFDEHMRELDEYLAAKQEAKREQNAEGFYPNPCKSCGEAIPRTGRPGRPPSKHEFCENVPEYTPEEQALLDELGL